jgi:hypothetical protein
LEPARTYDGPQAVSFDGYSLDKAGRPTFRYTLRENEKDGVLNVSETIIPVKASVATGIIRRFAVDAPSGYRAWLLAGQSSKEPRVVTWPGRPVLTMTINQNPEEFLVTASGVLIVLPQDGDRAIALEAIGAPEGTEWRFAPKSDGSWLMILRLPVSKENLKGTFDLATWALPKDDDVFLKELTVK